jgi:hypothetical protein
LPGRISQIAKRLGVPASRQNALSVRWRSWFPHRGYREHQRVPLWHEDVPFVLITSQRAGSTMGTAWFLRHADLLDEALLHDPFVHRYEQDVLLRQPGYLEGLTEALRTKPVYKLMRDPGARAFSSYIQLHVQDVANDPYDHRRFLRRDIVQRMGLGESYDARIPFAAFLAFLARADHRHLDGHEARQANLYEAKLPGGAPRVIRLEQAEAAMRRIEKDLHLSPSTEEDFFRYGATGHRVSKTDDPEGFARLMREGASLPRTGRAPKVTSETIKAFPDSYRDLRAAFARDFELYEGADDAG